MNNFEFLIVFLVEIKVGIDNPNLLQKHMIVVVHELTIGGRQMLVAY